MSPSLSNHAAQLITRTSTVMDLPNDHVNGVVNELVRFIADTPALAHLLHAQCDPKFHHTLPELDLPSADVAHKKMLYDAVCTVETSGDARYHLPETHIGQRYILELVLSWILSAQNMQRPS